MSARFPLSPLTADEVLTRFPYAMRLAAEEQRRVEREYCIPAPKAGEWPAWHKALDEARAQDEAYRDAHIESRDLRATLMVRMGEW